MITTAQLTTVLADGGAILDEDGAAIGRLDNIFVDDRTGMPEWVTAAVGAAACFIPLAEAIVDGSRIHVPYSRAQVLQAPPARGKEGQLSGEQESALFHYYGLQWLETASELSPSSDIDTPRQVLRSVRMRRIAVEDATHPGSSPRARRLAREPVAPAILAGVGTRP